MIKYIKMKKREIELKLMLYAYIHDFLKNKDSVIKMTISLVNELATTPGDELKETFISKMAELIHEQTHKERDGEGMLKTVD